MRVISVKFRDGGKSYFFDPGELEIKEGDGVIVETARGVEFADVVSPIQEIDESRVVAPLKGVVRIATDYDRELRDTNRAKEKDAFETCEKKIAEHGLEMKLVDVEYSYNGSKVMFYFTADGRVDFRELVKDLAGVFRTRIELRQIGVRDEAKMLGGLGSCGRPVCCKAFLSDFAPVSIKMAKEQGLSLSPTKISGICGRLMCCLKYEQDGYEYMRKLMPRPGRDVSTPDGDGTVIENNPITEKTKVRVTLADGTIDIRDYPYKELTQLNTHHQEFVENGDDSEDDYEGADEIKEEAPAAAETAPDESENEAEQGEAEPEEEKREQSERQPRRPRPNKPRRPKPERHSAEADEEDDEYGDETAADEPRRRARDNRPRRRPKGNYRKPSNKGE
jgi:cell fate regulator YaaT (PSP1 superfamily)